MKTTNLPIYYFCDIDDTDSGFNYQIEIRDVRMGYITAYNGRIFDNMDDFEEYIYDVNYSASKDEIERIIKNQEWEKSILVYFRPI